MDRPAGCLQLLLLLMHVVAVLSVLLSLFSNSCLVCTDGEALGSLGVSLSPA